MIGDTPRMAAVERRSWLGWIAITASIVSAIGLVILVVGDIANAPGADEDEEGYFIFDVAWVSFFLGGCVALLSGIAAYLWGWNRGHALTRRDGLIALAYCAVAAVVVAFAA